MEIPRTPGSPFDDDPEATPETVAARDPRGTPGTRDGYGAPASIVHLVDRDGDDPFRPRVRVRTVERAVPEHQWAFMNSARMRAVKAMVDRVAPTDATVLVWGESGVGKEMVARALHYQSPRRDRPFVKINCAALPIELLESELFGYERGAFTGAHRQKPGKFELANTGTIFLDEIGEMPLPLQAKLLQVLQDREFSRLGSRQDIRVDVRVLAATNKDLARLVERGVFREDLYYRLNVVSIHVPPLRERREEIPVLVDHFLDLYARQYARPRPRLGSGTLPCFLAYAWPGNVRELENVLKRIVLLGSDDWVGHELAARPAAPAEPLVPLPLPSLAASAPAPVPFATAGLGLKEIARRAAREAEREVLREVLNRVHWNRVEAARLLKVSYKTLLRKVHECGLED